MCALKLVSILNFPFHVLQTYPEFCRTWLEKGSDKLNFAIADLEAKYKKQAGRRPVLFFAWMVQMGLGVLPAQYFILAARRLHASCASPHCHEYMM
jgi:hypothetical protein